jgi:hypothetical protein
MIKFIEEWYLDKETFKLYKQIRSLVIGHETYNISGEVIGYKPFFRINAF